MSPLRIDQPSASERPTIAHLLDHVARIWRPVETAGDARQVVRTYEIVIPEIACAKRRRTTMLQTSEGGLVPVGTTTIYLDAGAGVDERDVIELTSGPDAPEKLEVESRTAVPFGHHVEVTASEFEGKLPTIES